MQLPPPHPKTLKILNMKLVFCFFIKIQKNVWYNTMSYKCSWVFRPQAGLKQSLKFWVLLVIHYYCHNLENVVYTQSMEHNFTQLLEKKNKISFCTILLLYTDFMSYCLSAGEGIKLKKKKKSSKKNF